MIDAFYCCGSWPKGKGGWNDDDEMMCVCADVGVMQMRWLRMDMRACWRGRKKAVNEGRREGARFATEWSGSLVAQPAHGTLWDSERAWQRMQCRASLIS